MKKTVNKYIFIPILTCASESWTIASKEKNEEKMRKATIKSIVEVKPPEN